MARAGVEHERHVLHAALAQHGRGRLDTATVPARRIGVAGFRKTDEPDASDPSTTPAYRVTAERLAGYRDAATAEPGETVTAAKATVDAQRAWANTTFMQRNQVVYLEPDFYTTEGIQAYTRAYQAINTTASQ